MVEILTKNDRGIVSFSFMPSLVCKMECPFCMYDCGKNRKEKLDKEKVKLFSSNVNLDLITNFGIFGGEISDDYDTYQQILDLLPKNIECFTITNGAWSGSPEETEKFISFVDKNSLIVFISSNRFQKFKQNQEVIEKLSKESDYIIKEEDDIIPMGRSEKEDWECSYKCMELKRPHRLTMDVNGDVFYSRCDGVYPYVGSYLDNLELMIEKVEELQLKCSRLQEKLSNVEC